MFYNTSTVYVAKFDSGVGKDCNLFSPTILFLKIFQESIFSFFFFIHVFICAYIVSVISPPCPPLLSSLPYPPHFQAEPVLPFSPILLKIRHKQ
jgi:hypothetical protein